MKTFKSFILESALGVLEEERDPKYGTFPIYGQIVSDNMKSTVPLTKLKIKNALNKLGGTHSTWGKNSVRLDKDSVKKAADYFAKAGFRKESDNYAATRINTGNKIYATFVKDQVLIIDVNGETKDGKFISKWPYPDNGSETKRLKLTAETVVVIHGRNTTFDAEEVWIANIFAPEDSTYVKDAKSGAYRFSFTRDMINEDVLLEGINLPLGLKKELGSWSKDVIGYEFTDKEIFLDFNSPVSKKELAKKLGVPEYDVTQLSKTKLGVRTD